MRLILRSVVQVLGSIVAVMILCHGAPAGEAKIPEKIDKRLPSIWRPKPFLGRTGIWGSSNMTTVSATTLTPPFLVYHGSNQPPAGGSFGFFAVNPWTGDVWALWGCARLSTPALRKSQAAIRRCFTRTEMQQYARLRRLKPTCTVED